MSYSYTPADVLCRYATAGGAETHVFVTSQPGDYAWCCLGCSSYSMSTVLPASMAREQADQHAGSCRALP